MNLAIHIGNSSTLVAQKYNGIVNHARISTQSDDLIPQLIQLVQKETSEKEIEHCIMSSVSPQHNNKVVEALLPFLHCPPYIPCIDSTFLLDYKKYTSPLGIDRAICCEAAALLCDTGLPFLVIDLGTATTINVVTKKGQFLGGMILPGLRMALQALGSGTSLLPDITLATPPSFLGTNTTECILSGAIYGNTLLLDGAIANLQKQILSQGPIFLTGGNAKWILPHLKSNVCFKPNLLMEGLFLLLDRHILS